MNPVLLDLLNNNIPLINTQSPRSSILALLKLPSGSGVSNGHTHTQWWWWGSPPPTPPPRQLPADLSGILELSSYLWRKRKLMNLKTNIEYWCFLRMFWKIVSLLLWLHWGGNGNLCQIKKDCSSMNSIEGVQSNSQHTGV